MPNYTTSDGHLIVIAKGGEQLLNNTYGFELEFCTHDSSVFAFTHVDIATVQVHFNGGAEKGGQTIDWKVETDSGNVLELVTTPINFPTTAQAYTAKDALAKIMTASVSPLKGSANDVRAVTIRNWANALSQPLSGVVGTYCYPGSPFVNVVFKAWSDIGKQLTLENVDDGINIKAAKLRWADNQISWTDYVGATVICRSEKDWGVGYSSQVNMPMTLAGYFLYVVTVKLPKAKARIEDIIRVHHLDTVGDSTIYQRVTVWFWSNIIADVANAYATALFGKPMDVRDVKVGGLNYLELRALALAYLVAQKVLTGALGRLSETNQLKLQEVAWDQQSTEAMVTDTPVSYKQLLQSANITTTAWNEYHSSMKDLTGLWFKAALMDVVDKEDLGQAVCVGLGDALLAQPGKAWEGALTDFVGQMTSKRWNRLWRKRDGYADDLEALDWKQLWESVKVVEAELGTFLKHYGNNLPQFGHPPRFQLPPARDRKFLHYAEAPAWEGRYDTMVSAIQRPSPDFAWTYLIEHRFH
jgi:hypothetical protein